MRIIFAGGGTGGHVLPALAVAGELRARHPRAALLFVGTRAGLEATLVPPSGNAIRYIHSRGVRGRGGWGKLVTLASLLVGIVESLGILLRFKPDLVYGSGGYASAAMGLAAILACRPLVIQEQNSIPGLTNRILGARARRIYVGFDMARERFGRRRSVIVTGNPLRREIVEPPAGNPRASFGLAAGRAVLLVFGGSQGAQTLNRAAADYLAKRRDVQGIIQTGRADFEWVRERFAGESARVFVAPFIANIHEAYRAADVALARAGALSVSELAAVALPAVLVPYPHAADDHQRHNAASLAAAGGAVVIDNAALDGDSLGRALDPLFSDPARLAAMRGALDGAARRDAAARIVDDIERLLGSAAGGAA